MSIIKMAGYALLGYTLYTLFRGMGLSDGLQEGQQQGMGESAEAFGGGSNITGPGEGMSERTEESSGASMSHRVGRGVV